MSVLLLYSLVYASLYSIRESIIIGSSWQTTLQLAFSTASVIAFSLASIAYILRWFAVYRARKFVIADKERYDVMWQSMISSSESKEQLISIQSEVSFRSIWAIYEHCCILRQHT